jgi:hypothetical protein
MGRCKSFLQPPYVSATKLKIRPKQDIHDSIAVRRS